MKTRECVNCNEAIELDVCPDLGTYYFHVRENPYGSMYCLSGRGGKATPQEHEYYAIDYEVWKLENDER
jgi:hypothetical protein